MHRIVFPFIFMNNAPSFHPTVIHTFVALTGLSLSYLPSAVVVNLQRDVSTVLVFAGRYSFESHPGPHPVAAIIMVSSHR